MLGNCYYRGHGVDRNYTEAAKWYQKAADKGNASGQFNLGDCYYSGKGVSKNRTTAIEFFKKAAKKDHKDAIKILKELGVKY